MTDFLTQCQKAIKTAEADNSAEFEPLLRAYLALRVRPEPPTPQKELPLRAQPD